MPLALVGRVSDSSPINAQNLVGAARNTSHLFTAPKEHLLDAHASYLIVGACKRRKTISTVFEGSNFFVLERADPSTFVRCLRIRLEDY
jgi:hypothetical protein